MRLLGSSVADRISESSELASFNILDRVVIETPVKLITHNYLDIDGVAYLVELEHHICSLQIDPFPY